MNMKDIFFTFQPRFHFDIDTLLSMGVKRAYVGIPCDFTESSWLEYVASGVLRKNATNRPCKGLSEYIGPDSYDFEVSNDDPKCLYRPKTRNYSILAAIWRITTTPYRRLNNTFDGGITIMENT